MNCLSRASPLLTKKLYYLYDPSKEHGEEGKERMSERDAVEKHCKNTSEFTVAAACHHITRLGPPFHYGWRTGSGSLILLEQVLGKQVIFFSSVATGIAHAPVHLPPCQNSCKATLIKSQSHNKPKQQKT